MMLRRTCQQVASLLVAREDRALSTADRVAIRLHMLACAACPRFEHQMRLMRQAMREWRQAGAEHAPSDGNAL